MSSPDNLTKLKATVDVYEKEAEEALANMEKGLSGINSLGQDVAMERFSNMNSSFFRSLGKLVRAYREYTRELERLVPR